MNENINLCEILKGHEGDTFYSESLGNVKLHTLESTSIVLVTNKHKRIAFKCSIIDAIDDLFPSKNQRDWNKWAEENNKKTPKIWNDIPLLKRSHLARVVNTNYQEMTNAEKSALAFLKIHQLIEVGYGGNVTNKEWINDDWKYVIRYYVDEEEFPIMSICHNKSLISFHTRKQAEEFLSYPKNVELLKDYFMI